MLLCSLRVVRFICFLYLLSWSDHLWLQNLSTFHSVLDSHFHIFVFSCLSPVLTKIRRQCGQYNNLEEKIVLQSLHGLYMNSC